jgi:hypothetical protein
MKVRVIRLFRVPDCDTRITRTKFGFCKLLPEIPEQNSGFGYSGFEFRVTDFLPSPSSLRTQRRCRRTPNPEIADGRARPRLAVVSGSGTTNWRGP